MKTPYLLGITVLFAGIAIGIGVLETCRTKPNPAVITEIQKLRDTVYAYKTNHYTDTFERIRTTYRDRIVQTEKWVYDSTWSNVCDSFGNGQKGEMCQRLLVRRIIAGQRDSLLIGVYQNQRTEDSMQIGYLMKLDSLNSEALHSLQKAQKAPEHQSRADRLKQAGKITLSAIVGFIVGRL